MSVRARNAVIDFLMRGGGRKLGLSSECVSLLRLVAWFCSEADGRAWPCRETLALLSGLSVRRVSSSMHRLVRLGLVRRSVRKTKAGDGWFYWLGGLSGGLSAEGDAPSSTTPIGDAPSSIQSGNRGRSVLSIGDANDINRGRSVLSIGDAPSPDKELKDNESECESGAAHTHSVEVGVRSGGSAGGSAGSAGSSPFGIYPVDDAVARLAVGDDPVPRSYIEYRARELTKGGGVLAKGGEVSARAFVAHCQSWWSHERDRERFLAPASAAGSPGGGGRSLLVRAARFTAEMVSARQSGRSPSDVIFSKHEGGGYRHGVDAIAGGIVASEEGVAEGAWDFALAYPDEKVRLVLSEVCSAWSGGRAPKDRFIELKLELALKGGAS